MESQKSHKTFIKEMHNRRVNKELKYLIKNPINGVTIKQNSLNDIFCYIKGPKNSFYENKTYKISVLFPSKYKKEYPFEPMKIKFITPIFHPNVNHEGGIYGIKELSYRWSPAFDLNFILKIILNMLTKPVPNEIENSDNHNTSYMFKNMIAWNLYQKNDKNSSENKDDDAKNIDEYLKNVNMWYGWDDYQDQKTNKRPNKTCKNQIKSVGIKINEPKPNKLPDNMNDFYGYDLSTKGKEEM